MNVFRVGALIKCRPHTSLTLLTISLSACTLLPTAPSSTVQHNADAIFEDLKKETAQQATIAGDSYDLETYLIGAGAADLSPRKAACKKVADSRARANLGKQIRVLVKSSSVDRITENANGLDQHFESVHEEMSEELLANVRIVAFGEDASGETCFSTTVMPKASVIGSPSAGSIRPAERDSFPLYGLPDMDIAEYEKQIQDKSAILRNKENLRAQVDQHLTNVALATTQAEVKDQPIVTLLETLRLKRQSLKASLEGAVSAFPDLVSNGKLEALRTEFHAVQEQLNKSEEQHASAVRETEALREQLKHLRERKAELSSEIDGLNLMLLGLVITKPIAVEGTGECVMHEDLTAKACKEMALLKAKQAAVEKGSATLIHSLTEVCS